MSANYPPVENSLDPALLGWIQELSPHGIFVTDTELRIKRWNLWLETNSGLKRANVINRSLLEVFPTLLKRRLDRYFHRALDGEVNVLSAGLHGYLLPFQSPVRESGLLNMLQTSRIAPLMEEGNIVGTITTIEDVTQREHQNTIVTRQHQRQELFSWSLAQLLKTPDPETMVKSIFPRISAHILVDTYFNYLLEQDGKHLRLHSSGGISREIQKKIAVITMEEALCNASVVQEESVTVASEEARSSFAKRLNLRAYICHPLYVGDKMIGTLAFASRSRDHFDEDEIEFTRIVAQYVAIAIDRAWNETALRKAQEELSDHAGALEQAVQERTRKLQETIADLESFSYSLAHDVRAPLRHIQGFSEALLQDYGEGLPAGARTYVDSIIRAIRRLEALTQGILEYSKLSNKSVELSPVDLEVLVKDVVSHNATLNAPGVVTVESPLQPVLAERSLLDQCLTNLLDNALKFIPAHVPPRIIVRSELRTVSKGEDFSTQSSAPPPLNPSVTADTPEPPLREINSRWIRIWVEDNGIGISPEFHGKIFGIFERLANQKDGTGIGLAIVSKAIQRMGGRLGVESESGKGSRFWLELPAAD
ncbi:MAG: GAF domain-containing protein [Verrucomicrobia bacterium]|nr:GAF domain-containing protein [Verrucomicrobiota bacterium]